MRRSFSIVAIGLVAVVMAPLSTAWSEDGTSAQDNEIFAAEAESSATNAWMTCSRRSAESRTSSRTCGWFG